MISDACHNLTLNEDICILPYGIAVTDNFVLASPGKKVKVKSFNPLVSDTPYLAKWENFLI